VTLPTFLVIGAMKAGTTSLWAYLRAHPEVFMPAEKELDFFVAEKAWGRGLDWYRGLFAPGAAARARGEASTNYTKHPLFAGVAERIARVLPDARLVYLVRHPIERIRSHYAHAVAAGWERRPLGRALREEPQYLDVSRYAHQLTEYLRYFDRSQLLVVGAEQLRDDRAATLRRVLAFIGVDPTVAPAGLEAEHHPTPRVRRPFAEALRRVPGASTVARLAPAPLRRAYARVATADPEALRIPRRVERELTAVLREDVAALREIVGPGVVDGWGIA
jgi:hypothetical protein